MDIARRAKAKKLALTHFDAGRYKSIQMRHQAAATAEGFSDIVVAEDEMVLHL